MGNNVIDGITGLLGETAGLYIFQTLFQTSDLPKTALKWVGGLKNPHEDLTVALNDVSKNVLGIQVKNTTKSIENGVLENINFMSRRATDILKLVGVDQEGQDILYDIYQMHAFNIEYLTEKVKGRKKR